MFPVVALLDWEQVGGKGGDYFHFRHFCGINSVTLYNFGNLKLLSKVVVYLGRVLSQIAKQKKKIIYKIKLKQPSIS